MGTTQDFSHIDVRGFAAEVKALRKEADAALGPDDIAHMRKLELAATACSAALSTLKRLTLVLSATTSSPSPTPTRRAILSPMRCGMSIQPALFQLRMRPVPQSCVTTCCTRAAVALGSTPSELPSR